MATADDSLYPIAVLIDELRNEDVQVRISSIVSYYLDVLCFNRCKLNCCRLIYFGASRCFMLPLNVSFVVRRRCMIVAS